MKAHTPEEYVQMDQIPYVDFPAGKAAGGDTAVAPGYGYESFNARHDMTCFPEDSEFHMTFPGSLQFIQEDGTPIAVLSWEQAQGPGDRGRLALISRIDRFSNKRPRQPRTSKT